MRRTNNSSGNRWHTGAFFLQLFLLAVPYFLIEGLVCLLVKPAGLTGLLFGGLWALLLSAICAFLPRKAGRICFGITYYVFLFWGLAQAAYYRIFGKMMWISTVSYAGEGAAFLGDVIAAFPLLWWLGGIILLALGVVCIVKFPRSNRLPLRLPFLGLAVVFIAGLFVLPELVFLRDDKVWGTHSEFAQSSSYRARYTTMYDAKNVYDICGVYQLAFRDLWKHEVYPLTPAYRSAQEKELAIIDSYFAKRKQAQDNEMTGIFAGKNVILVLMESMDDWMITPEDTPTLTRLIEEGIRFTNFYTPGYGSARTLNSEFCMNTGVFLPTTGSYVFDYVTNSFRQSIASQMTDNGYTSQVFHYNDPDFYSRGVFEPAMGYIAYNCYADYETDEQRLYDDCLLFDVPELNSLFFRDGATFNTIITRSAHLSYKYNEVLSHYALRQYPAYRGMYGSEEEDCARVKARLVDDMFARLLLELQEKNQLENTVIIGMTDHYTYGYKNMDELFSHSKVDHEMLLEKTPCFIWSADGPSVEVTKTLNTSDLLPTVLNLMGIESPYAYLGQDAFNPDYTGYALFPDGSWVSQGVACLVDNRDETILQNENNVEITEQLLGQMAALSQEYITVNNLLLSSDYYKSPR